MLFSEQGKMNGKIWGVDTMTHEELKKYLKEEYGGYALFEPEHYD